jgi:nicotinamidase-related amidase
VAAHVGARPVSFFARLEGMKALVIIDMLDDFVDGALANPRAQAVVPAIRRLLAHARAVGWPVVFSNDAHEPEDPELAVWGPHAMAGAPGSRVIAPLAPRGGPLEIVSPKRSYGAFDGTGLDEQLKALGVDAVVLTGQHTHICVRHSAYGAMIRGYKVVVPTDAVCTRGDVNEPEALAYMKDVYGATLTTTAALVAPATVA